MSDRYQIDAAKPEQHIAAFRKNADRSGPLLDAIGGVVRATRAVPEAGEDGRIPSNQTGAHESPLRAIDCRIFGRKFWRNRKIVPRRQGPPRSGGEY